MGGAASCAIVALAAATACEKPAGARGGRRARTARQPRRGGASPRPSGAVLPGRGPTAPGLAKRRRPPGPQRFCGTEA